MEFMQTQGKPRIVLVHDWLTGMRGGEKCLEDLCRRWPEAPLYTLLHRYGSVSPTIERRRIVTSFLQHLPAVDRYYRYLLPLMPTAAAGWRLPTCDLVISLSHCVAKSARPPHGVPHLCYCFTPMRYAWHQRHAYFGTGRIRFLSSRLRDHVLERLRRWDRRTATCVTHFVAISRTVRDRIREAYGRTSAVIYPPVDTEFYRPGPVRREEYYLVVSAFAPYKRLDLAVEACNRLRKPLLVIGAGQDEGRLRAKAGPTIHFLGWQGDRLLREHYRHCRALLFPGEEDFGIVPVEAQACGAPVIAFARGGATETVVPIESGGSAQPTGLWFQDQNTDSLVDAIRAFESAAGEFDPRAARRQAVRFNPQRFANEFDNVVEKILSLASSPGVKAA
jgi:glycosyltransferase involved in cell wall biosynthesis